MAAEATRLARNLAEHPVFRLSEDQLRLQQEARDLARTFMAPRAAEVDRSEEYPWANVEELSRHGLLGMTMPLELGGRGFSCLDAVLVVEEMAKVCGVTGRIVVETNMGAISAILAYGTSEQKKLAAGQILSGDKPAICITEPEAGSAAGDLTTRAEKIGEGYVLNGRKHWITGAGVSKLLLVFARVFENGIDRGIAGFIALDGETEGLRIGAREPTMGLRGIPEAEVILEDVRVHESMMLRCPGPLERSFAGLMNAYNSQRVGAAAVALGIAQGAFDLSLQYSKERRQFGRPICEFQGLQWMLADMHTALSAARLMVWNAALSGREFPEPLSAAEAKIMSAEVAQRVTNDALQIFGAAGYSRRFPLERMARDARMFTIGGGTTQLLRNLVASRILNRKLPQTRDGYLNKPLSD
jgi:alkylation response protein AidB-like acyl-CoA dehydrogenase